MEERFYWLGWSVFPGVGPGKLKLLLNHFKSAKGAWEASPLDLKNIIGEKLSEDFEEFRETFSIEEYLEDLQKKEVWFLTQKDPQYPSLLLQIDKPPIILYGKGNFNIVFGKKERSDEHLPHVANDARQPLDDSSNLSPFSLNERRSPENIKNSDIKTGSAFSSFASGQISITSKDGENFVSSPRLLEHCEKTIAVVGTRKITSYGREVTEILTRDLVQNGFVIVSGLAMGVDAVAHQTAIAEEGKTIAVLGCGVDLCYPSSNKKLYEEIISGNGVVVSEFPIGMTPSVGSFPSRNRIIAGLSAGVLVTEGAEDSGSLITADYALKYNRKVFAVPGPITSSLAKGPNSLISKGAKLVTSTEDIFKEFKIQKSKVKISIQNSKLRGDTEEEKEILGILQNEPLHFDEIVRIANLDSSKAGTLLTMMEIKGMIKSLESGFFSIVN